MEKLMSPAEVARVLNLKPASVRTLILAGKLKAINTGVKSSRYRIKPEHLEEFMQSRSTVAYAEPRSTGPRRRKRLDENIPRVR